MQKGYFAAAWGDITQSPGWISKFMRLGLLLLVPVFGIIVVYGYLYSWARDIAWNVHRPLPSSIFANEDGRLYSRGFFILVVSFVFMLIPAFVGSIFSVGSGVTAFSLRPNDFVASALMMGLGSGIGSLLSLALSIAACFFIWVGSMRVAIYGTLSSGFQLRKIWAMLRYDFMGLLRIFGMVLICGLVIGCISGLIGFVLALFAGAIGFSAVSLASETSAILVVLFLFAVVFFVLFILLALFTSILIEALLARALGYWTRQFDVAQWGGQDDPMPFEQRATAAPTYQQPVYASTPHNQTNEAAWVQEPYRPQPNNQNYPAQEGSPVSAAGVSSAVSVASDTHETSAPCDTGLEQPSNDQGQNLENPVHDTVSLQSQEEAGLEPPEIEVQLEEVDGSVQGEVAQDQSSPESDSDEDSQSGEAKDENPSSDEVNSETSSQDKDAQ